MVYWKALFLAGFCWGLSGALLKGQSEEVPDKEEHFPEPISVEELFADDGFWDSSSEELYDRLKEYRFEWVSSKKTVMRSDSRLMVLGEVAVPEVLIHFNEEEKPKHSVISLYNRGDQRQLKLENFAKKISGIEYELQSMAKVEAEKLLNDLVRQNKRETHQRIWRNEQYIYYLKWALSELRFKVVRPEFIQLEIHPNRGQKNDVFVGSREVKVHSFDLKDRVKREAGKIWLPDVPMVDQGSKGYCATATAERVLRFYGVSVDQHEMAQWSNTRSGGGTNPKELVRALKAMGNQFEYKVEVMEMTDSKDFQRIVKNYNRLAKRKTGKPIRTDNYVSSVSIYRAMNPEIYVESRTKEDLRVKRFQEDIEEKINKGFPVLWGVMLGIVKENPDLKQAFGGHMRLITGVDDSTGEIIYSDSWGEGHEYKRMEIGNAFAITRTLVTLEPY